MSQSYQTAAVTRVPSIEVIGGAGAGYILILPQTVAPSTPAAGLTLYTNSSGDIAWRNADANIFSINTSALTASRTWTFPDVDGDIISTGLAGVPNGYCPLNEDAVVPAVNLSQPILLSKLPNVSESENYMRFNEAFKLGDGVDFYVIPNQVFSSTTSQPIYTKNLIQDSVPRSYLFEWSISFYNNTISAGNYHRGRALVQTNTAGVHQLIESATDFSTTQGPTYIFTSSVSSSYTLSVGCSAADSVSYSGYVKITTTTGV
jgi:hypothetical protein